MTDRNRFCEWGNLIILEGMIFFREVGSQQEGETWRFEPRMAAKKTGREDPEKEPLLINSVRTKTRIFRSDQVEDPAL